VICINKLQKFALRASGVATALTGFGYALVARAAYDPADLAQVSASTTAAIQDGRNATLALFFQNLPYVVLGVIAVSIVLWGVFMVIRRITSHK